MKKGPVTIIIIFSFLGYITMKIKWATHFRVGVNGEVEK